MKKMLSLILAFVMIFGVFSFPVSADNLHEETGKYLKNLGIITGDQNGNLNPDKQLTREEAISILVRMLGKSEEAKLTDGMSGFTDVKPNHWAAKDITYARKAGLTNGLGDGSFGLGRKVTTKEIASFMLRALNHTADWGKEDIMAKAGSLGLLNQVSAPESSFVIRGEVFVIMKNTLYTKMNASEELLAQKLGFEAPTPPKPPVEEDPKNIELKSVEAENLKEIKLTFNSKIDKNSLGSAFRMVGGSLGTLTPELDDEKSVIVKVQNPMVNKKTYKIEVSKVKNMSGDTLAKEVFEFVANDVKNPEAKEVEVTGPKSLRFKFDEPIKTAGTVTVTTSANKKISANIVNFNAGDKMIEISTAALKEGESYNVQIEKFTDFAGYINTIDVKTFTYNKEGGEPNVEVESVSQEYVELSFDRQVKNLTLEHFYHTFKPWKPVAAYKSVDSMNENLANKLNANQLKEARSKVVVRFINDVQNYIQTNPANERPLPAGKVKFGVIGKVGSNAIVDSWGNALADKEFDLNVVGDNTAPEVVSVETVSDKDILVKFSEDIIFKKEHYKVSKANGTSLGFSTTVTKESAKSVKITLNSANLTGQSFKVRIEGVTDATIDQNKISPVEERVKFEDKTFAGMKEAIFLPGDGNSDARIRIRFDEAVDSSSSVETSYYKIKAGGSIKSTTFTANTVNPDVVEFTFTREEWLKTGAMNTSVMVAGLEIAMSNNVTDANGNKIVAFEQNLAVAVGGMAPTIVDGAANVMKKNEIVFWFDQQVEMESGWEYDKFSVSGIGVLNLSDVVEEVTGGKTKITLKLAENVLSADMTGKTLTYAGARPKNTLGVEHVWAAIPLVDKVAPSIAKLPEKTDAVYAAEPLIPAAAYTVDDVAVGEPAIGAFTAGGEYFIGILYDEDVDLSSISTTTYKLSISELDISAVARPSGNYITLKLPRALTQDEVDSLSIAQAGDIKDVNGNVKKATNTFIQIQKVFGENLK